MDLITNIIITGWNWNSERLIPWHAELQNTLKYQIGDLFLSLAQESDGTGKNVQKSITSLSKFLLQDSVTLSHHFPYRCQTVSPHKIHVLYACIKLISISILLVLQLQTYT